MLPGDHLELRSCLPVEIAGKLELLWTRMGPLTWFHFFYPQRRGSSKAVQCSLPEGFRFSLVLLLHPSNKITVRPGTWQIQLTPMRVFALIREQLVNDDVY